MTWKVDPTHSSLQFAVKHMMVASTRGQFKDFAVEATVDEENLSNSTAELTIDSASVDTGLDLRDNHLRSADFFDAENHPVITFRTRRLEPRGDGEYRVFGDMTIKDVTKEVVLDGEVSGPVKDPWGNRRVGISAEGKLNRKEFGLTWNAPLEIGGVAVSDTVKLTVDLELLEEAA